MGRCHYLQFPYLSDNYGVLVHDAETGKTAAIDAGDDAAYLAALSEAGLTLDEIWITHHHWDHTDGLAALKLATGALVRGPAETKDHIAEHIDVGYQDGGSFDFAGQTVSVIATPGHTLDMVNFFLTADKVLFSGDSLFVLGCGRLFEGDGPMMWESLQKLRALPPETVIYGSHEYSLANAKFALSVDPQNEALAIRAAEIEAKRSKDEATVPSYLSEELATNPFLRPDDVGIRQHLGMEDATDTAVFTQIRALKDSF